MHFFSFGLHFIIFQVFGTLSIYDTFSGQMSHYNISLIITYAAEKDKTIEKGYKYVINLVT